MVTFATLDWIVVILFITLIFALGFSAKLKENSTLQFLSAGRSLTLPFFVATLVSTWYGGILGVGESVLFFGTGTWLLLGVPYYAFAILYAFTLAKRVRKADQISLPERISSTFGKPSGIIAGILVFILGIPAAHALMLGTLVQAFTGWQLSLCIIFATLAGSLFLYKGGLLADVRSGVLAFLMMYIGFVTIVVVSFINQGSPGQVWSTIEPKTLLTFDGGAGPIAIVTFFILGAWTLIDPGFHQRVASAKTPETSQKGVLISVLFWILFDLLSVSTGLYALALGVAPENPLLIFPLFGDATLPAGLKAVFFCGMLGTILSAMVGYTLVTGASFGREIICKLKQNQNETLWIRIGLAVASISAIIVALNIQSVVALWYAWAGAVVGALLIPVGIAYGVIKSRSLPSTINFSMVLSFLAAFSWLIYGTATNNLYLNVQIPKIAQNWPIIGPLTGVDIGLGTLLPGLLISALVLTIGPKRPKESIG